MTGYYSVDVRDEAAKEQMEVVLPLKVFGQSWKRTSGPVNLTDTVIARENVTINVVSFLNQ